MSTRTPLLVAACLLVPACAAGRGDSKVPFLVEAGRYAEALTEASERYEETPEDERAEREYRLATVAVHLQRAREATFEEDYEEALAHVLEADRADPENRVVGMWLLKTRRRIADRWLNEAQELASLGELPGAYHAYEQALLHQPENVAAIQGRARTLLRINYRQGMGEAYYKEGVRSLRRFVLGRAAGEFDYTTKYIPDHEDAEVRAVAVDRLLAEERVAIAEEFEAQGLYWAAGNEFRLALLLDPESPTAQAGRERMEREVGAKEMLDHAEWLRIRERFDEAREAIQEGRALTDAQVDQFLSASIDIDQSVYGLLYAEALRLERDFLYEEAIAKYGELLEVAGYYEDAITRKATLEEFTLLAEDLYARALETQDPEERRRYLNELLLIWPEYRDTEALFAELE